MFAAAVAEDAHRGSGTPMLCAPLSPEGLYGQSVAPGSCADADSWAGASVAERAASQEGLVVTALPTPLERWHLAICSEGTAIAT